MKCMVYNLSRPEILLLFSSPLPMSPKMHSLIAFNLQASFLLLSVTTLALLMDCSNSARTLTLLITTCSRGMGSKIETGSGSVVIIK